MNTRPEKAGAGGGTQSWLERRVRERAEARRRVDDEVLAAAAALDPADDSEQAQYVRNVAESIGDHREMDRRRAEWAAADPAADAAADAAGEPVADAYGDDRLLDQWPWAYEPADDTGLVDE